MDELKGTALSDWSPHESIRAPAHVNRVNKLNELTASEWISETVSVWTQKGLGAGHPDAQIEREHPAPFSFTDISRLIAFFTKKGQTILDPFAGVASTLKACAILGRNGIGFELYDHFIKLSKKRLAAELPSRRGTQLRLCVGDARKLAPKLKKNSVDFIVTSPPYWNILKKKDHKARQTRLAHNLMTNYGSDKRDLGNVANYADFVDELVAILSVCGDALKPEKYMALVVSDFRDKGRFVMFHADLAAGLSKKGFALKGIKILYQRHKRVFPYGYPFAYVPNIHHQYILILQKEKNGVSN